MVKKAKAPVQGDFFEVEKVAKKSPVKKEKVYDCSLCKLDEGCKSPRMQHSGNGKRRILIIAEHPSATEDDVGEFSVDDAGNMLRRELDELGIDLDEDCWSTKAVICRTPKNREPTDMEMRCCRPRWQQLIRELNPQFIWLLGDSAVDTYFTGRFESKYVGLAKWRRYCIPDHLHNTWVTCTFDPSYVLRAGRKYKTTHGKGEKHTFDPDAVPDKDGIIPTIFKKDLKWMTACLKRKPPQRDKIDRRVRVLTNYDQIVEKLIDLQDCTLIIDYETSSTKPYKIGNRIYVVGFKVLGSNCAYAFPLQWPMHWSVEQQYVLEQYWCKVLKNPMIRKVAHNMKFEDAWSRVLLKQEVVGWHADTMLMVHTLDVREKLSGLKAQVFLRWGEVYDDDIRPYIESEGADGFNRLAEYPLEGVLKYCGLDCHFEEQIYQDIIHNFSDPTSTSARMLHLFHEGALALSDVEIEGIGSDIKHFEKEKKKLQKEVEVLQDQLLQSKEAKLFEKTTGRVLDLTKTTDKTTLFYEVLKEKVVRKTLKTQKPALDVKSMESFESDFAMKMVRMKRIKDKWIKTYLNNFIKETWDGKIHPFYNFNPETGRSGSDHPNFQNIPKRDKEGMLLIRTGIIPEKGFEFVSADYKQIEVSIQACYSHDAALIEYCCNTDADMHRDEAMKLFFLDAKQAMELRGISKNDFVFPQIYGDWYDACAKYIWEDIKHRKLKSGVRVKDHLHECGITSLEDYIEHVKLVERDFWNKFGETNVWRDEQVALYKKNLYVETYFGFRRNGFLRRNQICNTPVQSTAFHCLLWSLIELNKMRKAEKWRSKIVGQIHDQIVFMMHPSEKKELVKKIEDVMCEKIKGDKPWIIVPLRVDFEYSGIDKPWAYVEEK
jgi:uracil-DNA glycosylase family 4